MTESIWHVTWVGFVLILLPQILAYWLGEYGQNRGMWWPIVGAVILAPSLFAWAVTALVQPRAAAVGAIVIEDPMAGALAHAAVALLVQLIGLQKVR